MSTDTVGIWDYFNVTERCYFYMRPEIVLPSSIQNMQVSTIYILQSLQLQSILWLQLYDTKARLLIHCFQNMCCSELNYIYQQLFQKALSFAWWRHPSDLNFKGDFTVGFITVCQDLIYRMTSFLGKTILCSNQVSCKFMLAFTSLIYKTFFWWINR